MEFIYCVFDVPAIIHNELQQFQRFYCCWMATVCEAYIQHCNSRTVKEQHSKNREHPLILLKEYFSILEAVVIVFRMVMFHFCRQDNIVLIGHSAGAHLCALTTLFLIHGTEELGIEAAKQADVTTAIKGIVGK